MRFWDDLSFCDSLSFWNDPSLGLDFYLEVFDNLDSWIVLISHNMSRDSRNLWIDSCLGGCIGLTLRIDLNFWSNLHLFDNLWLWDDQELFVFSASPWVELYIQVWLGLK